MVSSAIPAAIMPRRLRFPGRAGELQAQGASISLIRELGDNYARYHAPLAEALAQTERPRREDFDSAEAFLDAYATAEDLIMAEVLLRLCRANRLQGRPLDSPLDLAVPVLDKQDRLQSVE